MDILLFQYIREYAVVTYPILAALYIIMESFHSSRGVLAMLVEHIHDRACRPPRPCRRSQRLWHCTKVSDCCMLDNMRWYTREKLKTLYTDDPGEVTWIRRDPRDLLIEPWR